MRDDNQDPGLESASPAVPAAIRTGIPCTSTAFAGLSAEILRSGVALRFQARGTSMAPLVRDGDVLLVWPREPGSVRIGDVALCSVDPGRVVVHRVIRKESRPEGMRFTVQGDQAVRPDGLIPAAQILGWVVAVERAGIRIDMDRPVMRLLGRLAALCSRWGLTRNSGVRLTGRLVRRLPGFSEYLA